MRLLREPLLHFLILGAALFGLSNLVGKKEVEEPAKIVVSATRIANLTNGFARTWQRPPTGEELKGLIEDYVRDEVFYREGKAMGLDRDDVVIRRRLRQKMEFVAEGMGVAEPSNDQLSAYLASHPDKFRSEGRLTFRQVFLSAARRPQSLESDAEGIAAELARASTAFDATTLGDHFLLGGEFRDMSGNDVAGAFGERFAERLSALEQGRWQGPIPSAYGLHFILLEQRTQAGPLLLDAVRQTVRREWMNERRVEAEEKLYRTLRKRYEVAIETPVAAAPTSSEKSPGLAR
jgi:hypothetical protein